MNRTALLSVMTAMILTAALLLGASGISTSRGRTAIAGPGFSAPEDIAPALLVSLPDPGQSGWGAVSAIQPPAQEPGEPVPAGGEPGTERAPRPEPEPISAWNKAPGLAAAVAEAMEGFSGRYSVAVQDLISGERWVYRGKDRYHPASTIKLPVTLYALAQYQAGRLGWQDLITYTEADFESPGGGAFETAPFGGRYPVENLVNRALIYSNNVAVNMLGRHLGWQNVRDWTRSIDGELYREPDGSPSVTVLSELGWWLHLHRLSAQEPETANLLLRPLREVAYMGRIAAGLPDGVPFVHKFGSYNGNNHDGALIFGDRPYALVILTGDGPEHEADRAIPLVTAAIHGVLSR